MSHILVLTIIESSRELELLTVLEEGRNVPPSHLSAFQNQFFIINIKIMIFQ